MLPPALPADASPYAAGQVISHYALGRRLGRGGFGEVWEAVDQRFGRKVAIKFLLAKHKDDRKAVKRFKAEAVFTTLISHPSIVQLLDTGQTPDGSYYHVMEYLEGVLLLELLREADEKKSTIGMPRAAHIAWQIAVVLKVLHGREIIHRDLKPHNLMLVADPLVPGGLRVKILDFGIAKLSDDDAAMQLDLGQETTAGAHLGSPIIMAREQWRTGEPLTPAVDVYALGCILYKMLAGTYPFEGDVNQLRIQAAILEPTPLIEEDPTLPVGISELVQRMLAKLPTERPLMEEVLDALGKTLDLNAAAAGPVLLRPTAELNALVAELPTGSTGSVLGPLPTPAPIPKSRPPSGSLPAMAAVVSAPAISLPAIGPSEVVAPLNTSARNGQQVPSEAKRIRRARRRQRRILAATTVGLLLCGSAFLTWRILNKPEPIPGGQGVAVPASSRPAAEPSHPAGEPKLEAKETTGAIAGSEAKDHKRTPCVPIELNSACILGPLSDAQKGQVLRALHEAGIKYCGPERLVVGPDYSVRVAKGIHKTEQQNFPLALRALLRLPSLPGEIEVRCRGK